LVFDFYIVVEKKKKKEKKDTKGSDDEQLEHLSLRSKLISDVEKKRKEKKKRIENEPKVFGIG